jgi:hypothetical protein
MVGRIGRRGRSLALGLGCALSLACGAPAPEPKVAAVAAGPAAAVVPASVIERAPVSAAEPTLPAPVESPGFAEALVALRPAAAAPALAALQAAPNSREPYAQAAMAYAATDAPAMTLIWGMTYLAMGGGVSEPQVAQAFVQVLNERVVVGKDDKGRVAYNVRLAPGRMPIREQPDGSIDAPLAHAFEGMFGATLVGFEPPWSVEQLYDVLSSWVGLVATRGTPLDEVLELDGWLVTLAKAGQLEAYCFRLVGSAFPVELKAYKAGHAKELKALDEYLKNAALQPKHATMPDALVRLQ